MLAIRGMKLRRKVTVLVAIFAGSAVYDGSLVHQLEQMKHLDSELGPLSPA